MRELRTTIAWMIVFIVEGFLLETKAQVPVDTQMYMNDFIEIFDYELDYSSASEVCSERGGMLAEPRDEGLDQFIYSMLTTDPYTQYYIGLIYDDDKGMWTWENGDTLTYTNWYGGVVPTGDVAKCGAVLPVLQGWIEALEIGNKFICQRPDYCNSVYSKTCENGGGCSTTTVEPYYLCDCTGTGYFGANCSISFCDFPANAGTCQNSGLCVSTLTEPYYVCDCTGTGYYGQQCAIPYCDYPSHSDTCNNGGVCESTVTSPFYECHCDGTGFYGDRCEDDYCTSDPCKNGGSCTATTVYPYFKCECAGIEYYGETCEWYRIPCPQTKFKFPRENQKSDWIRLKRPILAMEAFTVCSWLTPCTSHIIGSLISYATETTNNDISLVFIDSTTLSVSVISRYTNHQVSITAKSHICVVASTQGFVKVYKNGVLISTEQNSATGIIDGGGVFLIGQEQDSFMGSFDSTQALGGTIENFMMWYRLLEDTEIEALYQEPCYCPDRYATALEFSEIQIEGHVTAFPADQCYKPTD